MKNVNLKFQKKKINCMKEHNVTIFCKNEIMTFLNYIKNKYGKDFLKNCKLNINNTL